MPCIRKSSNQSGNVKLEYGMLALLILLMAAPAVKTSLTKLKCSNTSHAYYFANISGSSIQADADCLDVLCPDGSPRPPSLKILSPWGDPWTVPGRCPYRPPGLPPL